MRVMVNVPDRLAERALSEHRTVRQEVEYLVMQALRELERREGYEHEPSARPAELRRDA